jgi:nucleotide-binding universal stress UspA family protein
MFDAPDGSTLEIWEAFVFVVLALSGVEAIANLTGVMRKPVYRTARKSIWLVAGEVAAFNLILTLIMLSIFPLSRDGHKEDMMAYMASVYIGPWGEWPVRIIAGLLLLSATNTAVNGLMSIIYVMSRDGELPTVMQRLNGFGAPWVGALVAAAVPALVLLFAHDLQTLAAMYALGVVGAVAIAVNLCAWHPRLRRWWRKLPMVLLGLLLIGILITLMLTKIPAVIFVSCVLGVGFTLRAVTRWAKQRRPRMTLLRQAIVEQLSPEAMAKPRVLVATAGSATNAEQALQIARGENAALVVTFVRDVALNYKITAENQLSLDSDPAAQQLFTDFLEQGHAHGVPIIPAYDTSTNVPETIAELAAINAVEKVLIGTSRRGTLHQIIKGSFQRRLESLLPNEITVQVLAPASRADITMG